MKRALVVFADAGRLRAVANARTIDVAWSPHAPAGGIARLRDAMRSGPENATARSAVVLVMGLGLLEVARPELPPLAPAERRGLLMRDADRWFPVNGAVAVGWTDPFAFASDAASLAAIVRALGEIAPVAAVTTIVDAVARGVASGSLRDGAYAVDGDGREDAAIVVSRGRVADVRRALDGGDATARGNVPMLDVAAVATSVSSMTDAPLETMLLDDAVAGELRGRRTRRWLLSAGALAAALLLFGVSAQRWRERRLEALTGEIRALTETSAPARAARLRAGSASRELAALSSAATGPSPSAVLARLGAVLPRDAFVQRLEWDGSVWRIDGSAADAPRIVPLLDADPAFADVRIVAASTRFVDGGRQRESFAISFRVRAPLDPAATGGARGTH